MRGDWELQDTVLCLRHRHPLVPLWSEQNVSKRFDFQTWLPVILEQLISGAFDTDTVEPTLYNHWLSDQLYGRADKSWLRGELLYTSVIFCKLLGAELNKIMPAAHPHQLGFAATQGGTQSLR